MQETVVNLEQKQTFGAPNFDEIIGGFLGIVKSSNKESMPDFIDSISDACAAKEDDPLFKIVGSFISTDTFKSFAMESLEDLKTKLE